MTRINTNVESLRGLRNYQKANSQLTTSLTRLSTGLKINQGKDNPSGLIAAETLRLQTTTIDQSIKNSNRASNVIATADGALGEIGGLLNQVRGLVQEGLNIGALSQDEINANQQQIDTALSAINRISQNTTFAGDKLLDGSKSFTTEVSLANSTKFSDVKVNEALFGSASTIDVSATITRAAEKAELRYVGGDLTAAARIEVGGAKGSENISLGSSSSLSEVRNAINNVTDSTGVSARIISAYTQRLDAVANSATSGVVANNDALTFTDARASTSQGANATLGGAVSFEIVEGAGANELNVGVTTDANGNKKVTINLATTAGASTSTADDVKTAIAQHAEASQLIVATDTGASTGAGVISASVAETALTGGTDAGAISFIDKRPSGVSGSVSVVLDATGNSQTLGVAVARSGTNNEDSTITITVGTDANGLATSSLANIRDAISADTTASTLVDALVTGDSSRVGDDLASTTLADTTGVLSLESSEYGSDQSVKLSVLSGSFDSYDASTGARSFSSNGVDIGVSINGQAAETSGLSALIRTSTLDAEIAFAQSANVLDGAASLTVKNGGALFQIGEQATAAGQIGIGIEAVNTSRLGGITGKIYELGTGGGKSLQDVRRSLDGSGSYVNQSDLVSIIDEALNRVNSLRGRLGAVQKNVIETNVSNLGVALENITEARSQIVDTDFAQETASLQKAQILTQAGISVLSIANQNPQQVLSLLR